ncbi:MAG: hypothetical protein JXA57_08235 [Armatimonadetes bacterium]|nr:hypothetical protein [Armatimonadota bacterium]
MTEEVTACPRCGAANPAHKLFCSRCAAELVAGAAAEVEPPRARGRGGRYLSSIAGRLHRTRDDSCHRLCQVAPGCAELIRFARQALLIVASLLPGFAHLLLGHCRVGLGLLGAFVLAGAVWFAFIGTFAGGIGAFCALSLIGSSVLDILRTDPTGQRRYASVCGRDVIMAAAIVGAAYASVVWGASAMWERATINQPILRLNPGGVRGDVAFQTGDRLLVSRRSYRSQAPSRGDVVLARVNGLLSVQRVLAIPGDMLEKTDGFLYLNEALLAEETYPLQPEDPIEIHGGRLVRRPAVTKVGPGRVAVWGVRTEGESMWLGPYEIPQDEIRGKVWVVYSPHGNRRIIDHFDPVLRTGGDDGTAGS